MKQFESFRTVLDDYIKNKFSSTLTYKWVEFRELIASYYVSSILLYLINTTLTNYVEHNRSDLNMTAYCAKMLKQLEYFFKLIVRSRVLYAKYVSLLLARTWTSRVERV